MTARGCKAGRRRRDSPGHIAFMLCVAAILALAAFTAWVSVPSDPRRDPEVSTVRADGSMGPAYRTYPWGGEIETRMYLYYPTDAFPDREDVPEDDLDEPNGYWRYLYTYGPVETRSGQAWAAAYMQIPS